MAPARGDLDAVPRPSNEQSGTASWNATGATPAFPFGFGLSYTTFEFANLRVAQDTFAADDALVAAIR